MVTLLILCWITSGGCQPMLKFQQAYVSTRWLKMGHKLQEVLCLPHNISHKIPVLKFVKRACQSVFAGSEFHSAKKLGRSKQCSCPGASRGLFGENLFQPKHALQSNEPHSPH